MRNLLILVFLFKVLPLNSQELNCQVVVNSDLVDQTNQQIFKTLESSLDEFINTNSWTDEEFLNHERITCSFVLNLTRYSADQFEGTLQIQSQRPIFMTDYDSPIINFLDKDVKFRYQEYQPLFYNSVAFESNLISLVSFYVYLVLGLDADTYKINGGGPYIEKSQKIKKNHNFRENT